MNLETQTTGRRILLIKLLSLLSLVRWYNIVLIVAAQYLASIYILNSPSDWLQILLDPNMFLLALSSALLIAAGYIINSFYDIEKDLINRPKVAMFNQIVSKPFRLYCYFIFNAIGIFCAFMISWPVMIFHILFAFGLWFYSHKMKKILFLGNITATMLSIASFFSICLYYHTISSFISLYVGFIFLVELTREIIKDMIAMKGDLVMGYETIPVAFGMRNTRLIIMLIQLLTISIPFFLYSLKGVSYIMLYFLFSAILVFLSLLILITDAHYTRLTWINRIYKIIILTGIASIVLF